MSDLGEPSARGLSLEDGTHRSPPHSYHAARRLCLPTVVTQQLTKVSPKEWVDLTAEWSEN